MYVYFMCTCMSCVQVHKCTRRTTFFLFYTCKIPSSYFIYFYDLSGVYCTRIIDMFIIYFTPAMESAYQSILRALYDPLRDRQWNEDA